MFNTLNLKPCLALISRRIIIHLLEDHLDEAGPAHRIELLLARHARARLGGREPLGLGGGSRLTGVLVLQRAEFRDLLWDVWTTLLRSRQLYLDSPIGSKLST